MEVRTITADAVFRVFTACPTDPRTLILDVRDRKHFERAPGHIAGAYCIRLSSNGAVLLDYSKREDLKWAADCWWDRDVIVYGDAGLKKDHPVVAFLAKDKHARSLSIYREGLEAFHKAYPFLVTTSVKAGAATSRRYPSQLAPLLYLGDWSHAEAVDRHAELGIKAVLTIHNHPDNLKLPPGRYTHKKIEMADVDTADIGPQLAPAYEFIETAMAGKKAVLVHCGAGVSRSAALCIAYLMRKNRWSAQAALDFVKSRRSLVAPNDGFWRTLCGLEAGLGITERSNIDAFKGFHGADAAAAEVTPEDAAALRSVRVTLIPAGCESAPAGNKSQTVAPAPAAAAAPAAAGARDSRDGRDRRQRSRSRDRRERPRSRSRERSRDRRCSRSRDRRRSRSRDRRRSRSRDRRRSRSRDRRRSRSRSRDRRPRDSERAAAGAAAAVAAGAPPPSAGGQQQQQQPGEERVDVQSTSGAVLECTREDKPVGHYVLELQRVAQEALVGRLPTCDIPLEHLSVSRAHAQFTTDGAGNLFLTDLGSAHGTNLDGVWIKPKVAKQLKVGSVLKFGASVREYKVTKLPVPAPRR